MPGVILGVDWQEYPTAVCSNNLRQTNIQNLLANSVCVAWLPPHRLPATPHLPGE
jgi:hypothetical protein